MYSLSALFLSRKSRKAVKHNNHGKRRSLRLESLEPRRFQVGLSYLLALTTTVAIVLSIWITVTIVKQRELDRLLASVSQRVPPGSHEVSVRMLAGPALAQLVLLLVPNEHVAKMPATVSLGNHGRREDFFFIYDDGVWATMAMADGSTRDLFLSELLADELRTTSYTEGCWKDQVCPWALDHPTRRPNWPNIAALAVWLLSVGTLLTLAVRSRKQAVPLIMPAG